MQLNNHIRAKRINKTIFRHSFCETVCEVGFTFLRIANKKNVPGNFRLQVRQATNQQRKIFGLKYIKYYKIHASKMLDKECDYFYFTDGNILWKCDFETQCNYFTNLPGNPSYAWSTGNSATSTYGTGPTEDYTLKNENGKHISCS